MGSSGATYVAGNPQPGMSNITAARILGVLNHTGAPAAADGTFAIGDVVLDSGAQEWLCTVAGSPGTWVAVGSGRVLGQATLSSDFTMTTAATGEDVPTMSFNWTYDGRPVRFVMTPAPCKQDQASAKQITISLVRSTDNAAIRVGARTTTASATDSQSVQIDSGPLTAYPSDAAAFVVGTTYTAKLRINSGSSSKATLQAASIPVTIYAITA